MSNDAVNAADITSFLIGDKKLLVVDGFYRKETEL
jgi:hypothetical protein